MRNFILILFCAAYFSSAKLIALAPERKVQGLIFVKTGDYYLHTDNADYELITTDPLVLERLRCLNDGDSISGNGFKVNANQISLNTIEYVGLKKLLAYWYNKQEVFNFADFSNLNYWHYSMGSKLVRGPFKFHYALSPVGKKNGQCNWKIFIADDREVVLGNLKWIAERILQIEIYDSNTGEIYSTKQLIQTML